MWPCRSSPASARSRVSRGTRAQGRDRRPVLVVGVSQSGTAGQGGGGAGTASFQDFQLHPSRGQGVAASRRGRAPRVSTQGCDDHGPQGRQGTTGVPHHPMTDVIVTSGSTSVSAEGDAAVEGVMLAFAKVDLQYKPQKPDGTLDVPSPLRYDLKAQKELARPRTPADSGADSAQCRRWSGRMLRRMVRGPRAAAGAAQQVGSARRSVRCRAHAPPSGSRSRRTPSGRSACRRRPQSW